MEDVKDVSVGEVPRDSQYLKSIRINYTQNGRKKYWDFVKIHNGVACVLFNTSRNVLILVRQFRPPVYHAGAMKNTGDVSIQDVDWTKVPPKSGLTLELCAGIVDATRPLNEIIKKEVLEECGYEVPLKNFEEIITHRSAIGVSGNTLTMFYAECTDDMKVSQGGGVVDEGELIDVVEMSTAECKQYLSQDAVNSPGGLLFALLWFITNKAPKDC